MTTRASADMIAAPADLTELDQWVLWRYEERNGKQTKVPYAIKGTLASSTDPTTWAAYEDALATFQSSVNKRVKYSGIGFVFSPAAPYSGIDLDNCLEYSEDGSERFIKPWARPIIEQFNDTYMEVSPSMYGVKIWARAKLPGSGKRVTYHDGAVEMYDQGRYFTVTGNVLDGAPMQIEEHQGDVERLYNDLFGGATKPKADLHAEAKVSTGERHDYLMSVAAQYRAKGMTSTEILFAIRGVNAERCEPPKPEDELRKIVEWVCTKPAGERVGHHDLAEAPTPSAAAWPGPLDPAALHGVAGDIVRTIDPQTEADPVAVLLHILVSMGNLWGRGPHFRVGGACHYTNENVVCVGPTSSGRKGTAKADTFQLLRAVDETWADNHVMSGLSSGEGFIWAVRDEIQKHEPIRGKDKRVTGYQDIIIDNGVTDKRLLVIEPEFASVLRVAGRDGNTLSEVYRQAWDTGMLRVMNKNSPLKATGAHISILGHITRDELLMELTNTDKVNGFGNRNLWACVRRSKFLPDGGDWGSLNLDPLIERLQRAAEFARGVGEMRRDTEARAMWHTVYPELSGERSGMFGALTSRAEAHSMRLACIYALLDRSAVIRRCHLEAGLEVWRYCEDSARFIFGDALGNPVVGAILKALKDAPDGMTRNEIRDLFHRHRSAEEIGAALSILASRGLVVNETEATEGRPVERWFALSARDKGGAERDKGVECEKACPEREKVCYERDKGSVTDPETRPE